MSKTLDISTVAAILCGPLAPDGSIPDHVTQYLDIMKELHAQLSPPDMRKLMNIVDGNS